ncbi:Hybrid signal transduction histidine kinase K [Elsinoe australis]|uniref:histidine kinase n=1 Tax=Elsinoe australis TaxID=40998 RepID=A0A2P8A8K3_9PEZI|nr:Hybrid signal transduction histidine kinase K [Elsinoe australis]
MEHVFPASDLPPDISTATIADYFRSDSKPTLFVDISKDTSEGFLTAVLFINNAFRSSGILLELLSPIKPSAICEPFISWVYEQSSASIVFGDCLWSGSMINDHLRVISGIALPDQLQSLQFEHRADIDLDRGSDGLVSINIKDSSVSPEYAHRDSLRFFPEPHSPHIQLIQDHDWDNSAFGPTNTWIASLRHQVQFMLSKSSPGAILWGPERLIIYNEAFHPLIGAWHPDLMGKSLKAEWSDFWSYYERICEEVEATESSVSVIAADGPLFLRDGCLQETFFTFQYIPLFDSNGNVTGVYDQAADVTNDMYAQGRMSILQRTSDIATTAKTQTDLWNTTIEILRDAKKDIPLVAMYSVNNDISLADIAAQIDHIEDVVTWVSKGSAGYAEDHLVMTGVSKIADLDGLSKIVQQALSNTGPTRFTSDDNEVARKLLADYYQHFIQVMILQIENALKLVVFIEAQARLLQETVDQAAIEQQLLSEQLQEQTRKAQESALRFLKFAEQAPARRDSSVQYSNKAYRILMGLPESEGSLRDHHTGSWKVDVHPDDLEEATEEWARACAGTSKGSFEWRNLRYPLTGDEDKDVIYLRSSTFAELDENGKMKTLTGLLMDRSIEVAHERITNARMEAALEEKRAQEYFMDMVSHEMRNPLNAMIQCAEEALELLTSPDTTAKPTMVDKATAEDCVAVINTILYCGRHQKEIIDDVLTLSKLDANLLTICPVPACPETVASQALKIFMADMRASGVQLEINFQQDSLLQHGVENVLLDPGRTLQVLINLIGNAIKFMKGMEERRLLVSLSAASTVSRTPGIKYIPSGRSRDESTTIPAEWKDNDPVYISFSITDTGPGLAEADMNALFARFKQASPRTHSQYGGSGLGLFISRELTELHDGEIGVASEVGRGSTFTFYVKGRRIAQPGPANGRIVPQAASSVGQVTEPQTENKEGVQPGLLSREVSYSGSQQAPLHDVGVLIVEDNVINQQVLERQLRKLGCRVTTANHGEEALDRLKTSSWFQGPPAVQHDDVTTAQFSIILCDLEMPVMDGKTCVKRIREWQAEGLLHKHIPVLAVTGNARVPLQDAQEWGFDAVVSKPFSVKSLVPLFETFGISGSNVT